MATRVDSKSIRKNISVAIIAQAVSLATAFVFNLIVPKFIPIEQYSSWQTFALYLSYVGVLHFGLLDGLMLRYSHYDYDELDKPKFRSQFILLLLIIGFLTIGGCVISFFIDDVFTGKILFLVSIGILSKNLFTYNSYTFQLTNRITHYASLTIVHRLIMGSVIILLILCGVTDFVWFCLAELIADFLSSVLCSFYNKGLYFGKLVPWNEMKDDFFLNVQSGIQLLIANWASMLLVGSARMIIQWHYDLITFGKVSFAFSLTNLFLSFITSISIVLFPSIKRISNDALPDLYARIRGIVSPFLFAVILFYFPGAYILSMWLPEYNQSLVYLGILLPMIVFSSKVMLLTNNYLKAFRKERAMLKINTLSMLGAISFFMLSAYVIDNLYVLILSVLFSVALRSIYSEAIVSKLIGKSFIKEHLVELILTIIFVIAATRFSLLEGAFVYLLPLLAYLIYNFKSQIFKIKTI